VRTEKAFTSVIPGRPARAAPGIHTHDGGYGFRARARRPSEHAT